MLLQAEDEGENKQMVLMLFPFHKKQNIPLKNSKYIF